MKALRSTVGVLLAFGQGAAVAGFAESRLVESELYLGAAHPKTTFVTVSSDGRRLAAIVSRRGFMKQSFLQDLTFGNLGSNPGQILVDGELGPEYRNLVVPTFSPDGRRFVYLAMLGPERFEGARPEHWPKKFGPFQVILDGEEGPIYPLAIPPLGDNQFVFSPDGSELVFQVTTDGRSSKLMVNRTEEATFDGLVNSVVYSPDGKHRALIADHEEQRVVIVDGEERGRHTGAGQLVFSADSQLLAYVARGDLWWYVVVDGVEQRKFERVWRPVLSPDGSQVAYWARDGKDKIMVLDGDEVGRGEFLAYSFTRESFTHALGPVFSPDGERLAFVLKEDKSSTLVVGDEGQVLEESLPFHPSFSPDSKRIAYGLFKDIDEMLYAVVDGQEHPAGFYQANRIGLGTMLPLFRHVAPRFSPDGEHFAYLRTKKPKRWHKDGPHLQVVIDELGSSYFDRIIDMAWEGPSTLWAVVQRGADYVRLEIRITETAG